MIPTNQELANRLRAHGTTVWRGGPLEPPCKTCGTEVSDYAYVGHYVARDSTTECIVCAAVSRNLTSAEETEALRDELPVQSEPTPNIADTQTMPPTDQELADRLRTSGTDISLAPGGGCCGTCFWAFTENDPYVQEFNSEPECVGCAAIQRWLTSTEETEALQRKHNLRESKLREDAGLDAER